MVDKQELERRMIFAREKASQAWCTEETKFIEMNPALLEAFARILVVNSYAPHLGCATTGQMLREIAARVDLDYKTLGDSSNRAVDCPHPVGK